MDQKKTVSIILPVSGEQTLIDSCLNHLLSLGAHEIIVVEGGSQDNTESIINQQFPTIKYQHIEERSRAQQFNKGAQNATGDILLFVHADMHFPESSLQLIENKINSGFDAGCFKKKYNPTNILLKTYGFLLNNLFLPCKCFIVGTNGIFAKRDLFLKLGGFPSVPILEDLIFSRLISKEGKLSLVQNYVTVSSRKYMSRGILSQIRINARVLWGHYILKENPETLRKLYER